MRWLKVRGAAEYAGGLSQRTVYQAIRSGRLRAARLGAGRNVVTSAEWIDGWLGQLGAEAADLLRNPPAESRQTVKPLAARRASAAALNHESERVHASDERPAA